MTLDIATDRGSDEEESVDDYIDVDNLFAELEDAESDRTRRNLQKAIVTKAIPLADHIACRFMGRGEASEDLVQVARLALVKAVKRYDRGKGRFVSFAVPTISGEVRKHFRDNTWGMHVPRRYQEATLALRGTAARMSQELGRTPTLAEVADELDMSSEDLAWSQVAVNAYRPLSLDAPVDTTDGPAPSLTEVHGDEDPHYSTVEDLIVLADLVDELPERERAILRMRFYENLKQRDIAERLGISQMHVSRLLTGTLEQLRVRMCTDGAAIIVLLAIVLVHC